MGPLDLADIEELKVKQGQQRDKIENAPKDKAIQATDKAHKAGNITDEEHIENLKNAPNFMQIIEEAWQDTKEFKPWYQPGENIGALGARAIESMIPTNFQELQQELVELKAAKSAYPVKKLVGEIPFVKQGLETVSRKMDDWLWNPMFSKANRVATEGSPNYMMSEQTERMATGFKENVDKIPKKNRATDFELIGSDVDNFAKVTRPKIKKLVDQFGGSDEVVDSIFQEQVVRFQNIMGQRGARTYLNQYFKKLTAGLGPDGLKNAKVKAVNGKPTLVDGRTKKTLDHAFEVDHQKAKEMMKELGLEGADMHENLEIVYSEFNRAKNNIGNPAIPDQILEAVGQSTTLENFVRRRVDESFMLAGERVPQRFKEAAKKQMLDDAMNLKSGETLESVIEKRLKLYDKASIELVKADDYLPPDVQLQISAQDNLNPIEYFSELSKRSDVPKRIRNKYKRLAEDFRAISQPSSVTLERGYGANEASKTKYYRDDGHEI